MSEQNLRDLAGLVGPDWEKLATFLGFTAIEISILKHDNPLQTEQQSFCMLVTWKQRQSSSVDQRGALGAALERIGRVDLYERLTRAYECRQSYFTKLE